MTQFLIIVTISFIGEGLHAVIPLPIPASIYGMLIMLAALMTKVIKLHQVKQTSNFLLDIMSIMFIPAAVGLMNEWQGIRDVLLPMLFITIFITFFTMVVTGRVTQSLIMLEDKKTGIVDVYEEKSTKQVAKEEDLVRKEDE